MLREKIAKIDDPIAILSEKETVPEINMYTRISITEITIYTRKHVTEGIVYTNKTVTN